MNKNVRFRPIGERILVLRDNSVNKTSTGIILSGDQLSNKGTVKALGTIDTKLYDVEVGDRVMLHPKEGIIIKEDEVKYELIDITYILGIFK